MTREEAEEHAKNMTYRDAVCNALQGRCIPYRKATLIKLYELLDRLEQEPCEDAISREATLKPYNGLNDEDTISVWLIRKNIEQQPPVTPQPKWIPVSERLPEKYGEYLITWTTSQSKRPFIGISEGEVTGEYDHEHNRFKIEWLLEDYIKAYPNVEVIAWMPLPAPYESYESEDKG